MGKGTYGSKKGRPPKKGTKTMNKGLSKLPQQYVKKYSRKNNVLPR